MHSCVCENNLAGLLNQVVQQFMFHIGQNLAKVLNYGFDISGMLTTAPTSVFILYSEDIHKFSYFIPNNLFN